MPRYYTVLFHFVNLGPAQQVGGVEGFVLSGFRKPAFGVSPLEPVLSTMWLQKRFDHLNDFFAAGRAMGFRQFEPGVVVTPTMLEGVVPGLITSQSPVPPALCPSD